MSKIVKPQPEDDSHIVDLAIVGKIEQEIRDNRVLETFWGAGSDYEAVRKEMDMQTLAEAQRAVVGAIGRYKERDSQKLDAILARHAMTLEKMHRLLMAEFEAGSLGFHGPLLKVMEREARMRGIDAQPNDGAITTIHVDIRLPHEREEVVDGEIVEIDVTPQIEGESAGG